MAAVLGPAPCASATELPDLPEPSGAVRPVDHGAHPPFPLQQIAGIWRLNPSAQQSAARRDAIETAIAPLAWVVRMFAAPILHRNTAPPERLQFYAAEGSRWFQRAIGSGSDRTQPIEFGRSPIDHLDPRGEVFRASWRTAANGVLELHWEQTQAVGHSRYRLDPKTDQLIVEQTIRVTELPDVQPIVLVSRFDRQENGRDGQRKRLENAANRTE